MVGRPPAPTGSRVWHSGGEGNGSALAFAGTPPDAKTLGAKWHVILQEAALICDLLPTAEVGTCMITTAGELYRGLADDLRTALENRRITFHAGTIRGVLPSIKEPVHGR